MSGKHRRFEADRLPDVDVAAELRDGPLIEAPAVDGAREAPAVDGAREAPAVDGAREAPPEVVQGRPDVVRSRRDTPTRAQAISRRQRAAAREAKRKALHRQLLRVGGVVLAVVLVVAGVWIILTQRGDGDEASTASPNSSVEQRTLLIQVSLPDGVAGASALVGIGKREDDSRASALLVPSRLLVDVAGSGTTPFGETSTLPDAAAPSSALTDLLGVNVEDHWVLSTAGLAQLVDGVGGISAPVDVDVVARDSKGDDRVIIRAGTQQLSGEQAAAYATYLADGEPEQARLARFSTVLQGVIAGLPHSAARTTLLVSGLGSASQSSLRDDELGTRLESVRRAAAVDELVFDVLPVNELDTGGSVASYGIAAGEAADLLRNRFPGALQEASGRTVRVLVENGVGTPGLGEQARSKLVEDGFRFVNGGNAASFDVEKSVVLIQDGQEKSQDAGRRVADSLGLPADSIEVSSRGQTVADVIVILGQDFAP